MTHALPLILLSLLIPWTAGCTQVYPPVAGFGSNPNFSIGDVWVVDGIGFSHQSMRVLPPITLHLPTGDESAIPLRTDNGKAQVLLSERSGIYLGIESQFLGGNGSVWEGGSGEWHGAKAGGYADAVQYLPLTLDWESTSFTFWMGHVLYQAAPDGDGLSIRIAGSIVTLDGNISADKIFSWHLKIKDQTAERQLFDYDGRLLSSWKRIHQGTTPLHFDMTEGSPIHNALSPLALIPPISNEIRFDPPGDWLSQSNAIERLLKRADFSREVLVREANYTRRESGPFAGIGLPQLPTDLNQTWQLSIQMIGARAGLMGTVSKVTSPTGAAQFVVYGIKKIEFGSQASPPLRKPLTDPIRFFGQLQAAGFRPAYVTSELVDATAMAPANGRPPLQLQNPGDVDLVPGSWKWQLSTAGSVLDRTAVTTQIECLRIGHCNDLNSGTVWDTGEDLVFGSGAPFG